jgi:lactate dehydrogenase-like 2-hydroxyacid dehydrogenase
MKPEILVLGTLWTPDTRAQLNELFHCHFLAQPMEDERDVIGLDEATLAALPSIEIVAVHGVGVDAVPRALLAARGVLLTNTPDVLTDDVADLASTRLRKFRPGASRRFIGRLNACAAQKQRQFILRV